MVQQAHPSVTPAESLATSVVASDAVGLDGVSDVLVFHRVEEGFELVGGTGRGASWAGIVSVRDSEPSLVQRAWRTGVPNRTSGRRAQQIVGPYHARHAIAVPVGDGHVVVFGSARQVAIRDADLVRVAAATVNGSHGVPADKLLADELELVHTLRALMAYRPENVRDTLRHIATVAAAALSCEVAVISVENAGRTTVETVGISPSVVAEPTDGSSQGAVPWSLATHEPRVEQAEPTLWKHFGIELASSLALPVGRAPAIGVLALGHRSSRPRGFTSLCQRIGRAVADAAELLITQAMAREQLADERDTLARVSTTDSLTGLANRRAWDQQSLPAATESAPSGYVISCDLDELKTVNDRFGHSVGDDLLRAAGELLVASVRKTDFVARMGGDEFAVLLPGATDRSAAAVRKRIRRAEGGWSVTQHSIAPRMSIGMAKVVDGDLEAARRCADEQMYANKRRRAEARARRLARA